MKTFFLLFSIILFTLSCSSLTKTSKPSWINYDARIKNGILEVIGISPDFGNRSWQMAEIDAHKKWLKY